jgi:RNA polymerase sigma factor (TIGR02999 family)
MSREGARRTSTTAPPPPTSPRPAGETTLSLRRLAGGDRAALDSVVSALYGELSDIAKRLLRREWSGTPLSPAELVHEAYLRLRRERRLNAAGREPFLALAANVMRRVLIDVGRGRARLKRGGGGSDVPLVAAAGAPAAHDGHQTAAVRTALERLRRRHPRGAAVIAHRVLDGLSVEESAAALGVSSRTVKRDWLAARDWLRSQLGGSPPAAR